MIKLEVKRHFKGERYTIGKMYLDGIFFCDTLEDVVRDMPTEAKIMHETAIPAGKYKVVVSYSPAFKRLLPLIQNVPYFTGIRIHRGNTAEHTSGCILVGENKAKGRLINSTPYEIRLVNLLRNEKNIQIEID